MLTLTDTQRERLRRALESLHRQYDPAEQMLRKPFSSPGYHTTLTKASNGGWVHPTRDALGYAVALLDTGEEEWRQRAEAILRRVVALQDTDPQSKTYGIWSWFLEEPLAKMAPPDWNWADFCGVQLLQVALDHRERLPADLMAQIDAAIGHAGRSIKRRDVKPDYTNIAIMGAYVTLVAGELYHDAELRNYGLLRVRRFYDYTKKQGAFTEYNSPTYTVVALSELGRLRQHVHDAGALAQVEELYRLAWEEIAHHFHAPTRQWAGPHSRCYSTLLGKGTLALIERSTAGRVRFGVSDDAPSLDEHRLPLPCPPDLDTFFTTLEAPRQVVETFVKDTPPLAGTTYLAPTFTLGSVNRGDLWNQRRALLAYWGDAARPAYLHLRFLHDGYDFSAAQFFSVQQAGRALAAINFATDGGDTHISLDRLKNATFRAKDLRLRFEFGGAAASANLHAPETLAMPALVAGDTVRLHLAVPYAQFGATTGHWETGHDKDRAWLDVVLHAGEAREFHLTEIDPAALGVAVQIATGAAPPPTVAATTGDGWLALAWDDLKLIVPTRPDKAGTLQRAFRAC